MAMLAVPLSVSRLQVDVELDSTDAVEENKLGGGNILRVFTRGSPPAPFLCPVEPLPE
jgi:hypothetical protein